MINKIKEYIETCCLLPSDKPVIVGLSGGSDSVSLLFILNRLGYKCVAAHCNFHLRAEESDADEVFCREYAEQLHLAFEKVDFDTLSYAAEQHISVEMAARQLRYEWFEVLRNKYDAQAIAVAHHRDDSNETMLLNLIRGTGIRGLCGIRPKNEWVVRPLLCVGKDELNRFINKHQLPYRTDSTNLSDEFARNYIRLRLIPLMKDLNPSVETALARTAEHLADAENIYHHTIEKVKEKGIKKVKEDEFCLSINPILRSPAPQTILYELIRPFGFTRPLLENIFRSLSGESGKIFKASDSDYQLLKDRDSLYIYKSSENTSETYQIEEKNTDFEKLPIQLSMQKVETGDSFQIDKSPLTATFDYDKVHFPLVLRKWQSGDWFIPFGMKGRKKLSDYFSDRKFSLLKKNSNWLLCSGKDIIWIVGERSDNRFRIDKQTKYALIVKFFSEKYGIYKK